MPPLIFCKSCTKEVFPSYLIYPKPKIYDILRYYNTGVMHSCRVLNYSMKKALCLISIICLMFSLCAGGNSQGYGVRTVATLVKQEYALAFRTGDITIFYVSAAIQVLNAQGKIDELNRKWFGTSLVTFPRDAEALNKIGMPEPRNFVVGIDLDSFPFAYKDTNGAYWGFDIELATAVCELLDWNLSFQQIEHENTYVELSSGNIDCAWGGIAIDQKMVDEGMYEPLGPYVQNDIIIASRAGSGISSKLQLRGKRMAMNINDESRAALDTVPRIKNSLGQIIRLTGGSVECFQYLYDNKCDLVLTDSTAAIYYKNR